MLSPSQTDLLRELSIGDDHSLTSTAAVVDHPAPAIDARVASLVRLAALIVLDPALAAYQREVQRGLDAGATVEEIVGVLLTVAPQAGTTLVVTAAPKLAMALGYDVESGLEALEEPASLDASREEPPDVVAVEHDEQQ